MFDAGAFIPIFVFSIPIIAIVGGITAGIVKTISQHRLMELAQRERIAAIERGVDVDKLPALPSRPAEYGLTPQEHDRRQSRGLMISGGITLATGIALAIFLNEVTGENGVWTVGLIPAAIGVALLISGYFTRSRNGNGSSHPPARPTTPAS